jgi:hypothetical protein
MANNLVTSPARSPCPSWEMVFTAVERKSALTTWDIPTEMPITKSSANKAWFFMVISLYTKFSMHTPSLEPGKNKTSWIFHKYRTTHPTLYYTCNHSKLQMVFRPFSSIFNKFFHRRVPKGKKCCSAGHSGESQTTHSIAFIVPLQFVYDFFFEFVNFQSKSCKNFPANSE